MKNIGVIEIGSNGLRFQIASCQRDDNGIERTEAIRKSLISLVDQQKSSISPEFQRLIIRHVGEWVRQARNLAVSRLVVVTTEIGRRIQEVDPEFWSRQAVPINILSPGLEAYFGNLASRDVGTPGRDNRRVVIDVGNGSMSVVDQRDDTERTYMAPLGAERIAAAYIKAKGSKNAVRDLISECLPELPLVDARDERALEVVLMGGLATKVAWQILRPSEFSRYQTKQLNGQIIRNSDIKTAEQHLRAILATKGATFAKNFVDRDEQGAWKLTHVLGGLSFFSLIGDAMPADSFVISTRSVRHGIIQALCDGDKVANDLSPAW